ncbi:phosphotransferase [Ornithinimicrobium cryptoxanthini]|uniref:phosphotransferase n=1 Tax=Ornithinimicrobium cryptoxanthini TaxID=2934161 RepID=UPI002117B10F|nr:phosphotransferase [Ornithinimicrobium cryptoxanthini]
MTALSTHPGLSAEQSRLLQRWIPDATIRHDHGWDLGIRSVLEVSQRGTRFIVKAGSADDHHMDREITAHERWLTPWASRHRAPELVHADRPARLLVTIFLPGHLVLDTPAQDDPDVFRQAGELLRQLHSQLSVADADAEARENARSLAWLDSDHRITPQVEAQLRAEIRSWPTPPSVLVPTHGDWQPRNWLRHAGQVRVIDFGRAALRPAMSDLGRLAAQDFARNRGLETAFLEGYGSDPREPAAWHRTRLREAIGTAVWAHQVGDAEFEAQGHAMIAAAMTPMAL